MLSEHFDGYFAAERFSGLSTNCYVCFDFASACWTLSVPWGAHRMLMIPWWPGRIANSRLEWTRRWRKRRRGKIRIDRWVSRLVLQTEVNYLVRRFLAVIRCPHLLSPSPAPHLLILLVSTPGRAADAVISSLFRTSRDQVSVVCKNVIRKQRVFHSYVRNQNEHLEPSH